MYPSELLLPLRHCRLQCILHHLLDDTDREEQIKKGNNIVEENKCYSYVF